jgi:hypothetical protein
MSPLFVTWLRFHEGKRLYQVWISVTKIIIFFPKLSNEYHVKKRGFMSDPSLAPSHFFLRTCVQKTENNLIRKSIPITAGKIVSDQTFGFWITFFMPHHYMLISGQPLYVFPYKPPTENRATIHRKLESRMEPDLVPYFQCIDTTDTQRIQIMSILN